MFHSYLKGNLELLLLLLLWTVTLRALPLAMLPFFLSLAAAADAAATLSGERPIVLPLLARCRCILADRLPLPGTPPTPTTIEAVSLSTTSGAAPGSESLSVRLSRAVWVEAAKLDR